MLHIESQSENHIAIRRKYFQSNLTFVHKCIFHNFLRYYARYKQVYGIVLIFGTFLKNRSYKSISPYFVEGLKLFSIQIRTLFTEYGSFWMYSGIAGAFMMLEKLLKFKKTLCVVTIAMICSNLASLWKFQYFRSSIYNPVEYLWWSFYCKNSKSLNIFTEKLHHRFLLGF